VKLPSFKRSGVSPEDRIPRGAIAVVVVGIVATIAAALLTGGGGGGDYAHLEWVQQRPIPDSKAVDLPGTDEAKMKLINGKIQATGENVAHYELFRILQTVRIDKGVKISKGKLLCSVHATRTGTLITQSSGGLRMTYPRSSETGIYGQPVEEEVLAEFASHGHEFAVLEVGSDLPEKYTTVQGVKLAWPEYEAGTEHLEYLLPEGTPKAAIELPFYTIWKTTKPPAATIACELTTAEGKATVETEASLANTSPPIDEEAEEAKREEKEESEEASGEGESSGEESEAEGE
jgi:hypothetical protein